MLAAVVCGLMATCLLFGAQSVLTYQVLHTAKSHPVQATFFYDLVEMSRQEHRVLVPVSLYPAQDLAHVLQNSNATSVNPLLLSSQSIVASYPIEGSSYGVLRSAWFSAIRTDPLAYIRERIGLAERELAIGQQSYWVYQYDTPAPPPYQPKFETLGRYGISYITFWANKRGHYGGPLYAVWMYGLVVLALALVWRSRTLQERVLRVWVYRLLSILSR